jgi:hypothetical protein
MAMLAESDLPGGLRLIASSTAGPSDADGMPEGWEGDSPWIFHMPSCDKYQALNITGFYSRKAIRINNYMGTPGRELAQTVERYPNAATAEKVFNEARSVVAACFVAPWGGEAYDQVSPLKAGDNSWAYRTDGAVLAGRPVWDHLVVRQGELITFVRAPVDLAIGDLSPLIVQRLCHDTASC